MMPNTGNNLNCPCGYANDLPNNTEKCPKCGLNLAPLSRIYQLSGKYSQLGDENKDKHRPGVALYYYTSAQQFAITEDTYPLVQAINIYIDENNSKLASDLLEYAKELYPQESIWVDIEKRLIKLKEKITGSERKQRLIRNSLYVASGLFIILLSSFGLFIFKTRSTEKPLDSDVSYFKEQLSQSPELSSINVFSDSLIHFSGKLDLVAHQKFWSILSSAGLPLSKVDMKELSINNVTRQIVYLDYKVRSGESLSKIAYSIYNDPGKWYIIFDANKDIVADKNFLKPGISLKIPIEKISGNE